MPDLAVPTPRPLATVRGVELVQAGQWHLSTGLVTFTADDLAAAVGALDCPAVRRPVLKLGHSEPDPDEHGMRWDGEPAVGWIANMALADDGFTLVGDYTGMPGWLGDIAASAYPDRSIEAYFDWRCQLGHTHPFVITAVALLGVVPPGVGTLRSLQDVARLYEVAASTPDGPEPVTVTIHASKGESPMPNPRPPQVAAGVTTEDVRRSYYENAPWQEWICEIQLNPLQLIVVDDTTGKYYRVPVEVTGEDDYTFGEKTEVKIRYEDVPADTPANAAASTIVYASRAESRPGTRESDKPVRAATVSDTPWGDFAESDYTLEEWRRACLIHPDEPSDSKDDYKLPVREPDGTLNRAGCHAAASRIGQVTDVSEDKIEAAAKELVALYRDELDEDPPEALLELAGEDTDTDATAAAAAAASQTPPAGLAAGPANTDQEGDDMSTLREGLREQLGISDAELNDEALLAAVAEALSERADPTPTPAPPAAAAKLPEGTVLVDSERLARLEAQAAEGVAAREQQRTEERDRVLNDAIKAGKFPPARREHWAALWDADPDGTRQTIADLAAGTVPLEPIGQPGGEPTGADDGAEFDLLFSRKAG